MLFGFRSISALIVSLPLVINCSGTSMNGVAASAGLGGSDSKTKSSDADSEASKASAPQQVSGAFLTCAYMETEAEVVAAAKAGQPLEIGCGLYQKSGSSLTLADISGLNVSTGIRCTGAAMQKVRTSALPKSSNLQYMAQVSAEQLPCALSMSLVGSGQHAIAFGRSISTITQTDASHGFSAAKDVQASGMSFAADRSPKFPSSPSVDLMQDIISQLPSDMQVGLNKRLKSSLLSAGGTVAPPSGADESTTVTISTEDSSGPAGLSGSTVKKPAGGAPGASAPKTVTSNPGVASPNTSDTPNTSNTPNTNGPTPGPVSNKAGT